MKIQPIDPEEEERGELVSALRPSASKSRLKRLFDRQFPGLHRISSSERIAGDWREKETDHLEPSSVCLDKMVRNFLEGANERQLPKCGRSRCNCFYSSSNCDDDDDEFDVFGNGLVPDATPVEPSVILKALVPCASAVEWTLLADATAILENCKAKGARDGKSKRMVVAEGLVSLGYDASVCRSKWEKSLSIPAGEYEYVDVVVDGGERLLLDIDFRSEFEIARPSKKYRGVLQFLPAVFVGRAERLQQIVAVAAEAANESMKKKGLHVPPWRKAEYMRAKWHSPHKRVLAPAAAAEEEKGGGNGLGAAATEERKWQPLVLWAKGPPPARQGKVVTGLAFAPEGNFHF